MSRYKPGTLIMIIEDCRAGGIATGQTGTYEGEFVYDTNVLDEFCGNPRIRLQDGSAIWGCECWWRPIVGAGPLSQEQEALEEHKALLREVFAELTGQDD